MVSREDRLKRLQSGYWDNAPQTPEPRSTAIRKSVQRAPAAAAPKRGLSDEAAGLIATVLKDFLRSSP
ncbi:MAG: hypothetical protein LBC70_10820 [Chitinispirillales bacterium]|jgi:hypothetical protein|nr:hypothetical protein [Chitinispirillales bacterium]